MSLSANQENPDWQVKITFLTGAEIAIRLGIKSLFDDVGLSTTYSFWSLLFRF